MKKTQKIAIMALIGMAVSYRLGQISREEYIDHKAEEWAYKINNHDMCIVTVENGELHEVGDYEAVKKKAETPE
jgi:hypothetical protein